MMKKVVKRSTAASLTFSLVLGLLIPLLGFILPTTSPVHAATWWNEDWHYRKVVTIDHVASEDNVYYQLTIDTSASSKYKGDCSDLRFLTTSGQNIPYHIVSGCGTATTLVQLLFTNLPAGSQDIYVYYGNPQASTVNIVEAFNNPASGVTVNAISNESPSIGPVGRWKFDEGYGSTAKSSASQPSDASLTNTTWMPEESCPSGKCLAFNGSSSRVVTTDGGAFDMTQKFTLSAWINPHALPPSTYNATSGNFNIFARQVWGDKQGYRLFIIGGGSSRIAFDVGNGTTLQSYYISPALTDATIHQWYYVVATFDSGQIRMYLNGKLMTSATSPVTSVLSATQTLTIGRHSAGGEYFNGFIDDPKVYDYARSLQQVQQDYAAGMQQMSAQQGNLANGLVGYWKMDETSWNGSAGEVKDASGSGNNGTAVNGVATSATSKFGMGASFDGNDDYVDLGTPASMTSRTYVIWSRPSTGASATGRDGLIGGNGSTRLDYGNGTGTTSYNGFIALTSGSPAYVELASNLTSINTWTHVALTIDDRQGAAALYVNGIKVSTQTWDTNVRNVVASSTQYLGRRSSLAQFNGSMDEARIYNRALSANEVSQLYNFAPKPIAYYSFEEAGGASAIDRSGNNLHATWAGSGTKYNPQGKYGAAGIQNAGSAYAGLVTSDNSLLDGQNGLTYGLWLKRDGASANQWPVILGAANPHIGYGLRSLDYGNNIAFEYATGVYDGNSWTNVNCSANLPVGTWKYFSITYDGSNLNFYQDGIRCSSASGVTLNPTYPNMFYLGAGGSGWQGMMDDVVIYNYARNQQQVLQDMQASQPESRKPLSYWKFDENNSTTAKDSGLAKIDGVITGCSWTSQAQQQSGLNCNGGGHVTIGTNAVYNSSSIAISMWLKTGTINSGNYFNNIIFGKESYPTSGFRMGISNAGLVKFWTNQSGGNLNLDSSAINDGQWHQIVVSYDGATGRAAVYTDGKRTSLANSGIYIPSTSSLVINGGIGGTSYSNSSIDEVKWYNQPLTDSEIAIDYNQSSGQKVGAVSTTPTIAQSGATASKPVSSTGSQYCVPGDSSACPSPIAEYGFEEGSGGSLKDTSGNSQTATWSGSGSRYASGKQGKAGIFNGSNDYASATSTSTLNPGSVSLSTWVKLDAVNGTYRTFVGKWRPGVSQQYLLQIDTDNKFTFWTGDGGGGGSRLASTTIPVAGRWYHLEGTQTGTTKNLYINGILEASTTSAVSLGSSSIPLSIGSKQDGSGTYFEFLNGQLDSIRLYNYARTPAQVAWDYNYGKPLAHYKMDECQGSRINDSSGNNLFGTLNLGLAGTTTVGNCQSTGSAWGNGATGQFGSSLSFDGIDDVVTVSHSSSLNLYNQFSLSAWIKPNSLSGIQGIIAKRTTNVASPYVFQTVNSGYRINYYDQTNTWRSLNNDASLGCQLNTTSWQHLFMSFDYSAGSLKIYRNSKLCGSTSITSPGITSNNQDLSLGRDPAYLYFNGFIDDVMIFNYALTSEQVKTLYNNGAVRWGQ